MKTRSLPLFIALMGMALAGALSAAGQGAEPERVFVEFRPGQKVAVEAALQAAGGRVHFEFEELSAIAVTLPRPALAGIQRNPNVVLVEPDPPRYPLGQVTPYGVDMVQAPEVWSAGELGGGIKIGVIDSGYFGLHEDFVGASLAGDSATDGCGHGTHVIGTILAVDNAVGVVGVAPAASVYSVKVFGDNCGWTYASGLIHAVQKAVNNGAKVISMSLGGNVKSRTEENAFKQFYSSGILSIAAAGNNGTTQNNYPASYASVVSVAAVDASQVVASFSQRNSQVELAAPGVGVLSTVPFATPTVTAGADVYQAGAIEFAATGTATGELVDGGLGDSVNEAAWSGKVVLVERGGISFYDKVRNVELSGGLAAILYNNVPGGFSGTLGAGNSSTIPAVSLTQEDGQALLLDKVGTSVTVNSPAAGTQGSGYAHYDGTSMATPHVSAVAALVWGAFPCATAAQVRTALQQSALDLGAAGRDTSYGYGLVQAAGALDRLAALGLDCGGGGGGGGDTVAPEISSVSSRITNAKNGSFEITWTTDEPATTEVDIGGKTYVDTALTTNHKRGFRGTKRAVYEYSVRSVDAAGNAATAGPFTHQN